jgi:pyruvate/2-oxoglutarate dehydrogenase complex dihydrolipoamide acyltransferase (E2) component
MLKRQEEKNEKKDIEIRIYLLEYCKKKLQSMISKIRANPTVNSTFGIDTGNVEEITISFSNSLTPEQIQEEIGKINAISDLEKIKKAITDLNNIESYKDTLTGGKTTKLDIIFNMLCDDVLIHFKGMDCLNQLVKISQSGSITFSILENRKIRAFEMLKEFNEIKNPHDKKEIARKALEGILSTETPKDCLRMIRKFNSVFNKYFNQENIGVEKKKKIFDTILDDAIYGRINLRYYEGNKIEWLNDVLDSLIDVEFVKKEEQDAAASASASAAEPASASASESGAKAKEEAEAKAKEEAEAKAKAKEEDEVLAELAIEKAEFNINKKLKDTTVTISQSFLTAQRQISDGGKFAGLTPETSYPTEKGSAAAHGLYEFEDGTYLGEYIIQHYCKGMPSKKFDPAKGLKRKDWGTIFKYIITEAVGKQIVETRVEKTLIKQLLKKAITDRKIIVKHITTQLRLILYSIYIVIRICDYIRIVRQNDMKFHANERKERKEPITQEEQKRIKDHQDELKIYTGLLKLLDKKRLELKPVEAAAAAAAAAEAAEPAEAAAKKTAAEAAAAAAAAAKKTAEEHTIAIQAQRDINVHITNHFV